MTADHVDQAPGAARDTDPPEIDVEVIEESMEERDAIDTLLDLGSPPESLEGRGPPGVLASQVAAEGAGHVVADPPVGVGGELHQEGEALGRRDAPQGPDPVPAGGRVVGRLALVDDVAEIPSGLRGQHPRNPVNRPANHGVQLELPPTARWNRDESNWSDHEGTGRAPQVDLVIAALSEDLEGLLDGEELGPVQRAFVAEDAYQCGYCTPGQVVAAEGLLRANPSPTEHEIRVAMSGNLCRCGTYVRIRKAIKRAARYAAEEGGEA